MDRCKIVTKKFFYAHTNSATFVSWGGCTLSFFHYKFRNMSLDEETISIHEDDV